MNNSSQMQDVFAESVDGMGHQTLEAGETELNRLRKLKLEKMGDLVLASRTRIQGRVQHAKHLEYHIAFLWQVCIAPISAPCLP